MGKVRVKFRSTMFCNFSAFKFWLISDFFFIGNPIINESTNTIFLSSQKMKREGKKNVTEQNGYPVLDQDEFIFRLFCPVISMCSSQFRVYFSKSHSLLLEVKSSFNLSTKLFYLKTGQKCKQNLIRGQRAL